MKTLINSRSGWPCALLISIAIGCKHGDSTDIAPANVTCLTQTVNNVTVENGNTSKESSVFNYDAKRQLIGVVSTIPGALSDTKITETYAYDDNGYTTSYQYASSSTLGSKSQNETYSYANGRLSTTIFKSTIQYLGTSNYQTTGTTTYGYDTAGLLAQIVTSSTTTSPYGSSSTSNSTRTYTNGVLTSIKESTNGKETTAYTIDSGRIMLETSSNGTKKRYIYNADGYKTKREELNAINAMTSSEATEYGSMPALKPMYPIQKGFPAIPSSYGKEDRVVSHSITNYSGKVYDYQFQYQLDSNGYPIKTIKTNTATNGTTTTTYTYAGCQ